MAGEQRTWIVVRHGSNSENQPMCSRKVVGVVKAANVDIAEEAAYAEFHCWPNQTLELIVRATADYGDLKAAASYKVIDVEAQAEKYRNAE